MQNDQQKKPIMTPEEKREKTIKSFERILEDKKYISAYARGEVTKAELDARGIKLAMPI